MDRFLVAWIGVMTVTIFAGGAVAVSAADSIDFQTQVAPVLHQRCGKCHVAEQPAGDVSFSAIKTNRDAARLRKVWRKAIAQIEAGEMPPADQPPLTKDESERLLGWMKQTVDFVDCNDPANRDPGPTLVRRLSLAEYNRTIRDLMGFEFDAASVGILEETGEGNQFGNLAAALDIPAALMEKYFTSADQILDRFFGTELSSTVDGAIQEQARVSREQLFGLKPGEWRKSGYEVVPPQNSVPRDAARDLISGFLRRAYRGQATAADVDRLLALYDQAAAAGLNYGDRIRLMLKAVLVSPKFLYRVELARNSVEGDAAFPVSDHELAVRLSYFLWSSMPDDELLELADRGQLTAAGPSTESVKFVGRVIAGPGSDQHHGNNSVKVFDGDLQTILDGPNSDSYWVGLDLGSAKPISRIRYAGRIGLEQRMVGGKFQASNSADFQGDVTDLFEVTEAPARGWVNRSIAPAVSARYIRYVPPKNSFGNIAEIEVRGPGQGTVLEQQVRRMLVDARARSLTDNFAVRWLQISKLPTARPSTEFFPEFNANIRKAMFDETSLFFDMLRREDRSLLELLDADYTFVNEDLARYYGLPEVKGKEMQRVALKPADHRGGLLGMGSILSLTSHTSRTSPTLRGKWILDVVLGAPPPPPPANVSQIKEEQDKKKEIQTFREKLKQHAETAACAACHRKMDPLGFALDNYNAVGLWREKSGDHLIDVSGELPTGERLNGIGDLKRILLARKAEFIRTLTEQMLTYALGRELDYYDDCPVQAITTPLAVDDYRFSTLVLGIVKSYPFQYRKNPQ